MTKKDYETIAGIMHRCRTALMRTGNNFVLDQFDVMFVPLVCEELKSENPRFNADKFTEVVSYGHP